MYFVSWQLLKLLGKNIVETIMELSVNCDIKCRTMNWSSEPFYQITACNLSEGTLC